MTTGTLSDRVVTVDIGKPNGQATRLSDVRIVFRCAKSAYLSLNEAEITLYNLSESSRAMFTDAEDDVVVHLQAGYRDAESVGTVAFGNIVQAYSAHNGPDVITRVLLTDGRFHLTDRTVSATYKAGSSALDALRQVIRITGAPVRFLADVPDKPFVSGWQYAGSPGPALTTLCDRLGLEWSIVDGGIQIIKRGSVAAKSATEARAIAPLISPATGLIGALEQSADIIIGSDKAWKYGWKFRCLLNARLFPGGPVAIQGRSVKDPTVYRVETVTHAGDTHGSDWYSEVTAWEKIA